MSILSFLFIGLAVTAIIALCRTQKGGNSHSSHDSENLGGGTDHSGSSDHHHTHHSGCDHDGDSGNSDSGGGDCGGGGDSGGGSSD